MEIEQFAAEVRKDIAVLKSEVTEAVSADQAAKIEPIVKSLAEVRQSLEGLESRADIKPTADKVVELEKRLIEAEAELRVFKTLPQLPANQKAAKPDFKGCFIADVEKMRGVFAAARGGDAMVAAESRAISSSLFVTGGRLPAEVADTFIDYLIELQITLGKIQVRRMMGPEGHTDELTVSSRKMRKATENVAGTPANAFGNKRRTLLTVEVIWPEDITLTWLEDNIERAGAEAHIARMLATAFGNDANDLAWNGDTADTTNGFRVINDGWITLMQADADVHDLDFSDTDIGDPAVYEKSPSSLLHLVSKALPYKFKPRLDLAYTVPVGFAEEYANELSTRETQLGDQVMVAGYPAMRYFGRIVRPEPHLYQENADKIVLTPDGNLFWGVQRQMTIDSEWKPRERRVEYTVTARTDAQYATGDAVVLGARLPSNLR